MIATVRVHYSCHSCGIIDREIEVPARGPEDVLQWLEKVCAVVISADHLRTSPDCRAREMQNLKIPIGSDDRVGSIIKQ
jgi:hypothetical protein